jgi:hypothetical protein
MCNRLLAALARRPSRSIHKSARSVPLRFSKLIWRKGSKFASLKVKFTHELHPVKTISFKTLALRLRLTYRSVSRALVR